ncbi:phosphotransferase [Paractinoplanes durhamensis]|uniref:phosphotransferase n=1 Tax=Paractinoplanes durhamensis TaxID=113563 RepID=UPI00364123A1
MPAGATDDHGRSGGRRRAPGVRRARAGRRVRPARPGTDRLAARPARGARRTAARPGPVGPAGWTHGDLQPYNLLAENGRVTGVLDWDRLGVRTYGLEVVRTATITFSTGDQGAVDLARVAAFALAYRVHIKVSDAELADAAHRRWWVLATDPWPLDRHYRDGDTTCDHLFGRRGRALRWWTGHRAEVIAALTHR